ncbi:MAG: M67 family metallopeptidase [Acidimicrobiales bacterium]|nr:M67 family metallopeptidase [Acidimicrobiales bacterium]
MLHVPVAVINQMVGHAYDGLPDEACGLLVGRAERDEVLRFVPTRNAAESSKLYTIDGLEQMKAERAAEAEGLALIGVMHSHTHTTAYPSPTDVAQAEWLDPAWHFVIVSLRDEAPSTRSYRIVGEEITEEAIVPVRR